ncbi:hypothetical protein J4E91_001428 [Alternaria rosae]|nr:hypothetical protein J4E91_001428 [Alternaria rosae]
MSYAGPTFPGSSATLPVSYTDAVPTSISTPSSGPSSGNPAAPSTPGSVPSIFKWIHSIIELLGYPIPPCWTVFQWIYHAISYPYPSGGINGTIVAPYPSYIEAPINTGHIVGAGKSSLAAIVVALVFAHFA